LQAQLVEHMEVALPLLHIQPVSLVRRVVVMAVLVQYVSSGLDLIFQLELSLVPTPATYNYFTVDL
jgi:hypothetical protein